LLENGVERVKITDFGLARAADDVDVTQAGMIAGTPQYMSPEQARGEMIDARSDLFSLGSVLYSMCTGRPAFRAETTMGVLKRVCEDTPRPIREVNAEIPQWLEAIVTKLLAKNPADRFQTAAEVAEQLGQHLAHLQSPSQVARPATVALPPPVAPPHAPVQSTSGSAAAVILTIAIVLIGLPVALLGLSFVAWFLYSSAGRPDRSHLEHYGGHLPADDGFTTLPVAEIESTEAADSDWAQLFNGQDLSGWKTHPDDPTNCWTVEDGAIVGRDGQSYLFTERGDYEDFHLRAEAQINATGDGGIVLRTDFAVRPATSTSGVAFTSGYEAQIALRPKWPVHTGSLSGPADQSAGDAVFEVGPLNPHQPDEWFQLEVIARGNHLQVFVDGKQTADYHDEKAQFTRGHLALQTFGPDLAVIRFRKIEIKELPPADAAGGVKPDSAEVRALRELVAANEQSRDDVKIRFNEGTVPPQALTAAEIDLLEARIRLAEAEGPPPAVVTLLQEMVAKLRERRAFVQQRVEAGIELPAALNPVDAQIADATARLAKAEKAAALK
jgi:hypothetical protein